MTNMAVRLVKDLLAQTARETFVGRASELSILGSLLGEGPRVVFLHGIAGVGKSALLSVFAEAARSQGAAVVALDCRTIEPTERGFLHELDTAIGGPSKTVERAVQRLQSLGEPVVLILDNYEVFRLMDTWLRQVFIPLAPDNLRLVIAGRDMPAHSWLTAPGWQRLVRAVSVDALSEQEAVELLVHHGATETDARVINRFAFGHPLALKLASIVTVEHKNTTGSPVIGFQRVFDELIRLYLTDVHDPVTRQALDAASVVRRITVSLLHAMLPEIAPLDGFERLKSLPFVEAEHDGLRLHELVQQTIASSLLATDPNRYQEYRRAAWQQLSLETSRSAPVSLWRYTADLLYMIANPTVREAFFPSDVRRLVVEPAQSTDGCEISEITKLTDSSENAESISMWWSHRPESFSVVRDQTGTIVGFYLMFDPAAVEESLIRKDPVTQSWTRHLANEPMPANQRVLFVRRWLGREKGEKPGSVQAACWLDIKRTYMELRPHLRRVYITVNDLEPYASVAQTLGFQVLEGKEKPFCALLDFGPGSVDGWLAGLGAAELGIEPEMLDSQSHELVLDGYRVKLTKLEFEVFRYLYTRKGTAVTRASLVEDVWGWKHTGSNVIEAVMRTLRKKLGDKSKSIETIRGLGYRFRNT